MKLNLTASVRLVFLFIITYLMSGCDPADNRLKIVNNSDSGIYFFYSCDTSLNNLNLYKTGYYRNSIGDSTYITSDHFIQKGSFRNIPKRGFNAWKGYLKDCQTKNIHIYIFRDSIVKKYSYEDIKTLKLYEKCLVYNANDLKQNNWTIIYP